MSGSHKTTATSTPDPAAVARANQNYQNVQNFAATPFQPYTGEMAAPLNATQQQAGGLLSGIAANNPGAGAIGSGIAGANGVLGYNPASVGTNAVSAGLLSSTDLSPYLNPYTSDVINTTLADNERARRQAQVADNQSSTSANAFGGSRSGVANALTNEAYDRNNLSEIAGLNQSNFQQAQQGALADIQNRYNASALNADNALAASQANAANGLTANGQRLSASGLLGDLGNTQFTDASNAAQNLLNYGNLGQQTQQNQDTANLNMWQMAYQDPFLKQQLLNQSLGLIPVGNTQTQQTSSSLLGNVIGVLNPALSYLGGNG